MNNNNDVKAINLLAILRVIYKNKSVTKSRIASELGLTIVTVNNLVSEICKEGICIEDGYFSSGGRRAALYRMNPDYGYIVSLDIKREALVFGICDLSFEFFEREQVVCDISDVMGTVKIIENKLLLLLGKYSGKRILGIGISVPGRTRDGVIIDIPDYPAWNSVQLAEMLSENIRIPIYIDNDTNALLLAAKCNGTVGDGNSTVYINADFGLGAAFMQGGSLFYGSNAQACELGHVTIDPNGPVCACGSRGCLEAYVAVGEIVKRINTGREEKIRNIEDAVALYIAGDARCVEILEEATEYLLLAVRNVVMLFDPETVILQNLWLSRIPELFERVRKAVFALKSDKNGLPMRSRLSVLLNKDERILSSASACIVFQKLFEKDVVK